jgi:hypothetical protein
MKGIFANSKYLLRAGSADDGLRQFIPPGQDKPFAVQLLASAELGTEAYQPEGSRHRANGRFLMVPWTCHHSGQFAKSDYAHNDGSGAMMCV